jgi:hypothetical protein
MEGSRLRPLICVGMAYFVLGVVIPVIVLRMRGEPGEWKMTGIMWSSAAGAAGAIGAFGIILAFTSLMNNKLMGSAVWVMPLIFGCAPVVNSFISIYWNRNLKDAHPLFWGGLIVLAAGAFSVLFFSPKPSKPHAPAKEQAAVTAPEKASPATATAHSSEHLTPDGESPG